MLAALLIRLKRCLRDGVRDVAQVSSGDMHCSLHIVDSVSLRQLVSVVAESPRANIVSRADVAVASNVGY